MVEESERTNKLNNLNTQENTDETNIIKELDLSQNKWKNKKTEANSDSNNQNVNSKQLRPLLQPQKAECHQNTLKAILLLLKNLSKEEIEEVEEEIQKIKIKFN